LESGKTAVHILHWAPEEAAEAIGRIRAAGYAVSVSAYDPEVQKALRSNPPAAILIDLSRRPAQGRDAAVQLRLAKATRGCALIFAGGQADKVAEIRRLLPDAVYTSWQAVPDELGPAIAHPIQNPVVPEGAFAAYAGRPLEQKLGLRAHSRIGLIHAPRALVERLGPVPEGIEWLDEPDETCDQLLLFARSPDELAGEIARIKALMGRDGLWIFWQKAGKPTGGQLTQDQVRSMGLAHGLVDFKITALDETWSGLRFAERKA
jgi:hypothetical protein